jgi:hypothetical protein
MVVAREWMLGSRDEFLYMECAACGCVQRTQIVPDMSRYYPQGKYYSISIHGNALRRLAFRLRARSYFNRSLIGKVVAHHWPQNDLEAVLKLNPKKDWRILDIGCGSGRLLFELADNGFLQLFGADPFIEQKIVSGPVCIWKSDMPGLTLRSAEIKSRWQDTDSYSGDRVGMEGVPGKLGAVGPSKA